MYTTFGHLLAVALLAGSGPAPVKTIGGAPADPVHLGERGGAPFGYLWTYKSCEGGETTREVIPYGPREGDLLFFDDMSVLWTRLYAIANTAPPFHAGIVVRKPDGRLAVLEAGPDDTLHVYVLDLRPRLLTFKGILQVRRVKRCLTADESARLTAFAQAQDGKRYAVWRLLLQGTPLKTRGGPLRDSLAHTLFNRNRWLCAEIAVTAAAVAGLTDPQQVRGSATYPLDIIDDSKHDLSATYEPYAYWAPHP